jgi:hypothetical protein
VLHRRYASTPAAFRKFLAPIRGRGVPRDTLNRDDQHTADLRQTISLELSGPRKGSRLFALYGLSAAQGGLAVIAIHWPSIDFINSHVCPINGGLEIG